jgi:hypothetical protein
MTFRSHIGHSGKRNSSAGSGVSHPGGADRSSIRSEILFIFPSLSNPRIILTNITALPAQIRLNRPKRAPAESAAPQTYDPLHRVFALERPCREFAALAAPDTSLRADGVVCLAHGS